MFVKGRSCEHGSLNKVSSPPHLQAPSWAFIMSALGLFFYQSLDAIDGKQARRTNSSSPLGELFDHGCDAVSTGDCSLDLLIKHQLSALADQNIHCLSFFLQSLLPWERAFHVE